MRQTDFNEMIELSNLILKNVFLGMPIEDFVKEFDGVYLRELDNDYRTEEVLFSTVFFMTWMKIIYIVDENLYYVSVGSHPIPKQEEVSYRLDGGRMYEKREGYICYFRYEEDAQRYIKALENIVALERL